jgi:uncharacterized membrane protein
VSRLNALTDGVVAIAITLLALSIRIPDVSPSDAAAVRDAMYGLLPIFEMYVASFLLIGFFWQMHHRLFSHITYHDHGLVWLNLAYLLPITMMPLTTELVGRYRSLVLPTVVYFTTLAATAVFQYLAWNHAVRRGLVAPDLPTGEVRYLTVLSLVPVVVFALGLAIASIAPDVSQRVYFLLLLAPLARRHVADYGNE